MSSKLTYEQRNELERIPVQKWTISQLKESLDHRLGVLELSEAVRDRSAMRVNEVKAELNRRKVPIHGEGLNVVKGKRPKLKIVKQPRKTNRQEVVV